MKKLFTISLTLVLLALSTTQLDAQTPRMGFYEEATQASCPPCAGFNPPFQSFLNNNSETAVFMAYQVWWPGFDPMYLDNEQEVRDRIGYYGITGAPGLAFQGNSVGQTYSSTQLSGVTSQMSEFALTLNAEIVNGVIHVTGSVDATMAASGDFRLRIALSEELITIQDAPGGTNGETEYHHVFKRFFGGSAGIDLQNSWTAGDSYAIDISMPVTTTNIYNFDQLEVIGWIQNDSNKYVHQAAKATDLEVSWTIANNVTAVETSGFSTSICSGANTIEPSFKLANLGSEMLTSAEITYSVNGGAEQTVNWTGNLAPLNNTTVVLDPISFDHTTDMSTVNVTVSNPNGVADENEDDNLSSLAMSSAPSFMNTVELTLVTDNYANETYWQLADDMGNVVASGGNSGVGLNNIGVGAGSPPANAGSYGNNALITESIVIPADGCYEFTITDFWGDGICCSFGQGSYELADENGNVLLSGGAFGAREDVLLEGAMLVGTQDVEFTSKFTVSPNPIFDVAQLSFAVETSAVTTVAVMNSLGQLVSQQNLGKLPSGSHNLELDMTDFAAGVYLINITSGDVSGTQKVVVANR
jgi:hypothetical protein